MGFIREVLFGKVDLDTLMAAYLMGERSSRVARPVRRQVRGSACGEDLGNTEVLCLEVGGSGRDDANCFDHHSSPSDVERTINSSAAAQVFDRLARVTAYVDAVDRGEHRPGREVGFPSLTQLVSGMLLTVRDAQERFNWGLAIVQAVVEAGLDPTRESMAPILDWIEPAKNWAEAKRTHDAQASEVCSLARWFTTKAGLSLAVIETAWSGAPGALYGLGADVVIALHPSYGEGQIRKYTLAGNSHSVLPALKELNSLESGWGGPATGTIGGSPQDRSSELEMDDVISVVLKLL